jgi:cation-transporting ATPase E
MTDIVNLFLTRVLTMALLIVSSLVIGEFPLALRHGSIVTLFGVGIPAALLAVWAQPGIRRDSNLLRGIIHFSMPPVLVTSALGVLLFYGVWLTPLLRAVALEPSTAQAAAAIAATRPVAQTALAVFVALTGLLLVIFVEPPTPWWTGGDTLSRDRRPAILAVVLIACLMVVTQVPVLRGVFALEPLSLAAYGLIFGAAALWLFTVRFLWRRRILDRFIGLGGEHPGP